MTANTFTPAPTASTDSSTTYRSPIRVLLGFGAVLLALILYGVLAH
jgi:hypothetical protein